jgi:5-methylcytosine-specific restriction endonuclease McrA
VAVLLRITADAIGNADGQRVWPPGLTPGSRARLADTVRRASGRRTIPKSKRFAVLMRDDYTCQYCGRSAPDVELHVDHRVPLSRGGSDAVANLATACIDCNLGKSNRFVT